jgi:hypothetical protein
VDNALRRFAHSRISRGIGILAASRAATIPAGDAVTTGADDFAPLESEQLQRFEGKQWQLLGEVMGR